MVPVTGFYPLDFLTICIKKNHQISIILRSQLELVSKAVENDTSRNDELKTYHNEYSHKAYYDVLSKEAATQALIKCGDS